VIGKKAQRGAGATTGHDHSVSAKMSSRFLNPARVPTRARCGLGNDTRRASQNDANHRLQFRMPRAPPWLGTVARERCRIRCRPGARVL